MADLHEKQRMGEAQPKKEANKDPLYKINENEQHLIHISLRVPGVDERTEQPMHKPFIQKFYPEVFNQMDKNQAFKGYIARIIHDPRDAASIAQDLANDNLETPLSRMNTAQLQARYREVFNTEEVPEDLNTNEKLREEIQTRINFINEEAEADKKAKEEAAAAGQKVTK